MNEVEAVGMGRPDDISQTAHRLAEVRGLVVSARNASRSVTQARAEIGDLICTLEADAAQAGRVHNAAIEAAAQRMGNAAGDARGGCPPDAEPAPGAAEGPPLRGDLELAVARAREALREAEADLKKGHMLHGD